MGLKKIRRNMIECGYRAEEVEKAIVEIFRTKNVYKIDEQSLKNMVQEKLEINRAKETAKTW